MKTVIRKFRDLYEFNDAYQCRLFANKIDRLLVEGKMSLNDLDREAKNFFGSGYSSEKGIDVSWRDYAHNISSNDISVRIWSDTYATMNIKIPDSSHEPTIEDFKQDLDTVLKKLMDQYKGSKLSKQLDETIIVLKIDNGRVVKENMFKEFDS